jgi:hypothetical protein
MSTKIVVRFARIEIIDGPVPFAPLHNSARNGAPPSTLRNESQGERDTHDARFLLWRLVLAAPPTPTAAARAKNALSSPLGYSREPPLPPSRSPAATGG